MGLKPEALAATGPNKSTANIDISVLFTEKVVDNYGSQSKAIAKATAAIDVLDNAFSKSDVDANANFVGYDFLTEDQLGDTSGSGDGAVNTLYSNGSQLGHSRDRQDWYQNRHDLEGISEEQRPLWLTPWRSGISTTTTYQDLAIGIPNEDIGDDSNTGAVTGPLRHVQWPVERQCRLLPPGHLRCAWAATQDGDKFGFSLAVGNFDGDRLR